MESDDFKTALEIALQFFPEIKLKREDRNCASKACLSNKNIVLRFLLAWDIRLVISSSSCEYWSENRALFVEGLQWAPSASFSKVLLAFGVTSVARSLASNRNWTTRTGCRRCLWPGALEAISLSPCWVSYHPPMSPVTAAIHYFPSTFFANSPFAIWQKFSTQAIIPQEWEVFHTKH